MIKRRTSYQITWYTELDNGYVDVRRITLLSKHSANIMYDKLARQDKTLSIELEEI